MPVSPFDVRCVEAKYPGAYCCADLFGVYIVHEGTVIGKGKKPSRAWANAVSRILQPNKTGGQRPRP